MDKFIRLDHSPNRCISAKNDNLLTAIDDNNKTSTTLFSLIEISQQCSKLSGPNEPIIIVFELRQGINLGGFPIYESFIPVIIFILVSVILIAIMINIFPCIFEV
jgi:hypothetical protein